VDGLSKRGSIWCNEFAFKMSLHLSFFASNLSFSLISWNLAHLLPLVSLCYVCTVTLVPHAQTFIQYYICTIIIGPRMVPRHIHSNTSKSVRQKHCLCCILCTSMDSDIEKISLSKKTRIVICSSSHYSCFGHWWFHALNGLDVVGQFKSSYSWISACFRDWTLRLTSFLSDVLPLLICTLPVWSICPGLTSESCQTARRGKLWCSSLSRHSQIVLSMVYDALRW